MPSVESCGIRAQWWSKGAANVETLDTTNRPLEIRLPVIRWEPLHNDGTTDIVEREIHKIASVERGQR